MSAPELCDLIVAHGHVVTMEPGLGDVPDGALAIRGGEIAAVGSSAAIRAAWTAPRLFDAKGGVVHPGFIDGHYHAGLHLSRGSIPDEPNAPASAGPGVFVRWINALTDEDEHASALMAALELVRNGFTGFVEAATAFAPDAVAAAAETVGIRASVTDCMVWDLLGGEPMAAEIDRAPCDPDRARAALGREARARRGARGLVRGHVALYGLGSASLELMAEAKALADELGSVWHQHQNFTGGDAGYDRARLGRAPLVGLAERGLLGPRTVFTHMNVMDDAEAAAVAASGMALVWHPGNAMYYAIQPGAPLRFPALHRQGTAVAFGTDVAKCWAFGDLPFIAYLLAREWGEHLPARALIDMAARGGARAMGMEATLGRLAPGCRADLVIRTTDLPDAQPNLDPLRQLMLVSRTKGVDTVIVEGEVVVRNGRATRVDEGEIARLARASAARVADRAGIQPTGVAR